MLALCLLACPVSCGFGMCSEEGCCAGSDSDTISSCCAAAAASTDTPTPESESCPQGNRPQKQCRGICGGALIATTESVQLEPHFVAVRFDADSPTLQISEISRRVPTFGEPNRVDSGRGLRTRFCSYQC